MSDQTMALLNELQAIDDREDRILDVLLRHGASLEESERRLNMVTIADLSALRDGLASLEGIIDSLQTDVARAEAAAAPTLPTAPTNGTASNGHAEATNGATSHGHHAAGSAPDAPAPVAPAAPAPVAPAAPAPVAPAPTEAAPSPAVVPMPTFEQLQERVRKHDADEAEIKRILRERLLALGATPIDVVPGVPAVHRTFVVDDPPMTGQDVKLLQHDINRRFEAWGIKIHVRVDGVFSGATEHAAHQALLGLGVDAADYEHGITPELRSLIRTPSRRTALQLEQAQKRRPWLKRLREREAGARPERVQPRGTGTKPNGTTTKKQATGTSMKRAGTAQAGDIAAAIESHGGRHGDIIVREANRHGLAVALVCAIVEHESNFKNVFGHDPVRNPIKSPPKGLLEVTEARYKSYLAHRKAGDGCQGVGYMQLTFSGFQDRADEVGGCWKAGPNIRVGCEVLADNIKRLGSTRQGIRAYNGSGPAAERYATHILERERVWRQRLAGAKATAHTSTPPTGTKGKPRTFKLAKTPMKGEDVRRLQHDLNARFEHWKIQSRISEDGRYGATTRHAAHQVLHGLGIDAADAAQGITPQLRSKIRNPSLRTPAEVARAKARQDYVAKLRKKVNAKGGGALRLRAYAEARKLLDVREVGGNNRGKMVMQIIKANHGTGPEPWCGDFVAWCYRKAGSKAVTRSWATVALVGGVAGVKRTKSPMKGDLVRYGAKHIGMFVCWCDGRGKEVPMAGASHFKTIEGNTTALGSVAISDAGGGEGVYTKIRARGSASDFLHVAR